MCVCVCDLAAQVGRVCGTTLFLVVLFCGQHACTWRVRTHIMFFVGWVFGVRLGLSMRID